MVFNLHLTFSPQWENVTNIRTFVTRMLSSGIVNPNDARKVATASTLLVENAIKYSVAGSAVIDIKKKTELEQIHLAIKNISDLTHLDTFETIYKQVYQKDAKKMYTTTMNHLANTPRNGRRGLAKIRYECQGDIRYDISDDIRTIPNVSSFNIADKNPKVLTVSVIVPVDSLSC